MILYHNKKNKFWLSANDFLEDKLNKRKGSLEKKLLIFHYKNNFYEVKAGDH